MNKLILVLLLVTHIFAFSGKASAFSTELITRFEITHIRHHEHSDEHQHDHDDIELVVENASPNLPTEEHSHRREIVVSSQIPYIQSDNWTSFFKIEILPSYPQFNEEPPQGPFLQGILRPPIPT